jgi:hypothetical protein
MHDIIWIAQMFRPVLYRGRGGRGDSQGPADRTVTPASGPQQQQQQQQQGQSQDQGQGQQGTVQKAQGQQQGGPPGRTLPLPPAQPRSDAPPQVRTVVRKQRNTLLHARLSHVYASQPLRRHMLPAPLYPARGISQQWYRVAVSAAPGVPNPKQRPCTSAPPTLQVCR